MTTTERLKTFTVETSAISTSNGNVAPVSPTFMFDQYTVPTGTIALPAMLGMISQKVTTQLLNDSNFAEWSHPFQLFLGCVEKFGQGVRVYELSQELSYTRQRDITIQDYYGYLTQRWLKYETLRPLAVIPRIEPKGATFLHTREQENRIHKFHMGLCDEFEGPYLQILLMMRLPFLYEVYVMIEQHDRRVRIAPIPVATLNSSGRPDNSCSCCRVSFRILSQRWTALEPTAACWKLYPELKQPPHGCTAAIAEIPPPTAAASTTASWQSEINVITFQLDILIYALTSQGPTIATATTTNIPRVFHVCVSPSPLSILGSGVNGHMIGEPHHFTTFNEQLRTQIQLVDVTHALIDLNTRRIIIRGHERDELYYLGDPPLVSPVPSPPSLAFPVSAPLVDDTPFDFSVPQEPEPLVTITTKSSVSPLEPLIPVSTESPVSLPSPVYVRRPRSNPLADVLSTSCDASNTSQFIENINTPIVSTDEIVGTELVTFPNETLSVEEDDLERRYLQRDRRPIVRYDKSVPRFVLEAMWEPQWVLAMQTEINALQRNHTWNLVSLPSRVKPVGCH
ncbi:unnamed protein product [Ilex paraguariensis]|uniref:Retrotransposon gag domain-containing protein n=1 Tax=Ilex paraguariensis TaxID=185542 RepID=A0ABC8UVX1_9AQUA